MGSIGWELTCSSSIHGIGGTDEDQHNRKSRANTTYIYWYACVCAHAQKLIDILWWCRWDYIEEGGELYKDMDRVVAWEKALNTWTTWVDTNIDPTKTTLFFQGISPSHYK